MDISHKPVKKGLILLSLLVVLGCGGATSQYPSYSETIAKYAPQADYTPVKVENPRAYPSSPYCDCPYIWYAGHRTFWYRHHWIFWDHGCWYYYPYLYVYYPYPGSVPAVYRRPSLNITQGGPPGRTLPSGAQQVGRPRGSIIERPIESSPTRIQASPPRRIQRARPTIQRARPTPRPAQPVRRADPPQRSRSNTQQRD